MNTQPTQRRLAAVLAADVVGYSKLMAEDEAGTLAALRQHREHLFGPETTKRGGRIVKLMGDGTLVEFASVVDAVETALAIQSALAETSGPIKLRIGVNLGDVIIDGDDIYGDGVNIAARLEALAEPGGICISSVVHDSLGNRIDAEFADTGEHEIKNIAKPVRVFSWPESISAKSSLSDKPTIAILAFDNLSGDPEQAYFADGITEDIITELSRYGEFMVIARNSTFAFKGRSENVSEIGAKLGADYVVEGSVRRGGDRVRVTAQLIDCSTDGHVWAERFDRDLTDIFEVQDEITRAIASALGSVLQDTRTERAMRNLPANMAAYDQFLRAWKIGLQINREAQLEAIRETEKVIDLDPDYARPYCALAIFYFSSAWNGWAEDFREALDRGYECARKAMNLDPYDAWARAVYGYAELWQRNYDRALAEISKAIELNPNYADGYAWYGSALSMVGDSVKGAEYMAIAKRLNPRPPIWYAALEARVQFNLREYAKALQTATEILASVPKFTVPLALAAVSAAALGEDDRAREFAERIRRSAPHFKLARARAMLPFKREEDLEHFLHWAKQAGIPE